MNSDPDERRAKCACKHNEFDSIMIITFDKLSNLKYIYMWHNHENRNENYSTNIRVPDEHVTKCTRKYNKLQLQRSTDYRI